MEAENIGTDYLFYAPSKHWGYVVVADKHFENKRAVARTRLVLRY
jgi:hypothetical protein